MTRSMFRLRRLQVESKELFLLGVDCPVASTASVPQNFLDQDRGVATAVRTARRPGFGLWMTVALCQRVLIGRLQE